VYEKSIKTIYYIVGYGPCNYMDREKMKAYQRRSKDCKIIPSEEMKRIDLFHDCPDEQTDQRTTRLKIRLKLAEALLFSIGT
jgi:hypothetical protein